MNRPINPLNFIPPAGIINAEYLVSKFSSELFEIHKTLAKKKNFEKKEELINKAKTLKHKICYYKNFYGFN